MNPKQKQFFKSCGGAFLKNPLFVLWLNLIMDLTDPGTFSGKLEVASFFAIYIHVQAV